MRLCLFLVLLISVVTNSVSMAGSDFVLQAKPDLPRLIILADMGNEPDEEQQMAHMLVNCNEFELEGLIAVTGIYLNENSKDEFKRVVHPELFQKLVDAYGKVEKNLRLHAPNWPTAAYLHSIVKPGQAKYGLADVGEGKSSEGSRLIMVALKRKDSRPINIVVNAGSNTLAQALVDLRTSHSAAEMEAMVRKLRVFENGAQDNCGAWICHEFPSIHWIRSNHQTYAYMGQASRGEKAAGPYSWKPYPRTHQGQHRWIEEHVMRGHGAIGEVYPYRFNGNGFVEGGGTIPWLGLVNKGLYDVDQPSWGGWSGRFTATKQKNVWSRHARVRKDEEAYGDFHAYTEDTDKWTDPDDGTVYENKFSAVWRWRQAMLNNCQARFDWCVKPYAEANHQPVAAIDGDKTDAIISKSVAAGSTLKLDASKSSDPDGDALSYHWYVYGEAGTYRSAVGGLQGATSSKCFVALPADAVGKQIHLILEVIDDSKIVKLRDYRRVVMDVSSP